MIERELLVEQELVIKWELPTERSRRTSIITLWNWCGVLYYRDHHQLLDICWSNQEDSLVPGRLNG